MNFKPLSYEVLWGASNEYARGVRFGRIVSLTYQGSPFIKTWEAIVQLGDQPNRSFVAMSMRDSRLARYTALTMQAGPLLRLSFTQVGIAGLDAVTRIWGTGSPLAAFRFQESEFDIYRIEQVPFAGANLADLTEIPTEVIEDSSTNLDDYMRDHLGG